MTKLSEGLGSGSLSSTLLGLLNGNIDVLRVIGRFLDIEGPTAVNRLRQAFFLMGLIE